MIRLKLLSSNTVADVETPRVRFFCRDVDNVPHRASLVMDYGTHNFELCVFDKVHLKDFYKLVPEEFIRKLLHEDPSKALEFVKGLSGAPSEPLPPMLHYNVVSIWESLAEFRIPQNAGEEVKNVS